jgi:hypothetical protein
MKTSFGYLLVIKNFVNYLHHNPFRIDFYDLSINIYLERMLTPARILFFLILHYLGKGIGCRSIQSELV